MSGTFIRRAICGAVTLAGAVFVPLELTHAQSGPVEIPQTWGGDIWDRPRLTGDWFGLRDEIGKKGVVLDLDANLTPQSLVSGGKDTDTKFWGNTTYTLNMDSEKMGLWPGGFVKVEGASSFGDSLSDNIGAFVAANETWLYPEINEPSSALMSATFTQFLSPKIGFFGGKIKTLDLSFTEFTGNYNTQFLNLGMNIPMAEGLVPISAFGGGAIFLPTEDLNFSALIIDPSGTPTDNDITDAFSDGIMGLAAGSLKIKPFGLAGQQRLTGIWSNENRVSLIQDPTNIARMLTQARFPLLANPGPILTRILEQRAPNLLGPVEPLNTEDDTWAVVYGFDQYFWQPENDPKRGIGLFFNFGATDGDANPVKYSYNVGIGGKGVVPSRPHDTFGIGWSRTQFSNNFVPFLRNNLNVVRDHEDAIEMYYNLAVTPWVNFTFDLQVINPALKQSLDSNNNLTDVDTAVVAGLRTYIRF